MPVRARPEFYDDGVQICVKKISRVISIKTVAMSQTLIEVGEIFFIQSTAARHAGKIEQVALCCLVYLPSWIPLEQIYSSLAAGVRARQCRFVIASTTVVQLRWFPSSTHTPYAVPIAFPGKPANPLVFNINKGMTLWPFDGFPDGPTKKEKVYIHCWWQIFHQCNPAPNWFQYKRCLHIMFQPQLVQTPPARSQNPSWIVWLDEAEIAAPCPLTFYPQSSNSPCWRKTPERLIKQRMRKKRMENKIG